MKIVKIVLALVVVVVVLVVAVLFFGPGESVPYQKERVELMELNSKNSVIYSLLVAAGIEEALVDATPEQVFVAYDLPPSMGLEASLYYVLGAVAGVCPTSSRIVLQVFDEGQEGELITVQTQDVIDFLKNQITEGQFKARFASGPVAGLIVFRS